MDISTEPETDELVEALRQEAAEAGDQCTVELCDRALAGDPRAYVMCLSAIVERG